ncbi:MAG: O-antigen ligase family protein [Candidatus Levybacteria bacterium]|nr:O-antigen ligase family protein [Candidatus Levybacteria bacterium]
MGILKSIFVIFLGVFCLGEIFRFNLGNNIYIKPIDIAVIVLSLAWIAQEYRYIKKIYKDTLFLPIALFIGTMILSLSININNFSQNEVFVAFSYIVRWVLYANLYFIVKNFNPKFKKKILYMLLVVGAIFTFFGFVQYLFYSNLRNLYYLGWDEHMHRMFSAFLDPNFAGAFFVLYLFFLLGILFYSLNNNKIKQARFIGSISIFALISIFLTHSRSALIMLLIATVIFFMLSKKMKWIIGIILVSVIFIAISSKSFNIENINLFRIASTEARIDSAKIAINIIKDNPLLGVGFNTYRYAQIKYGFRNPTSSNVSHADAGTDNSFLFVMATTGIIGMIAYLNLLWSMLRESYSNYKSYDSKSIQKYIGIIAMTLIVGIIISAIFINSLFYPFILIWMWVLLGFMEKK